MRLWFGVILAVALILIGGACTPENPEGSGDQGGNENTTQQPDDSEADLDLEELRAATIYIEARGGVHDADRDIGEQNYGSGSGFFIEDSSGLALTANHVVAGAGFLDVYVDGEDEPRGARVLGVSECSDLALIDVDGGGYQNLEWRDEPIETGLPVTAAGYPAGDVAPEERPDYTVTQDIINTTEADGESSFSSVDSVIEHAALIRGGSSGGPLVDEQGRIVGLNYAGREEEGVATGQQFAIAADEVQAILPDLREGNVASIGIGGEAYPSDVLSEIFGGTISPGVGVFAVDTGSPAGEVGLEDAEGETFDLITELEGTRLGENGNMQEYCNILRNRGQEEPISIQVFRLNYEDAAEDVVLEGELNTDNELEEVGVPADFIEQTASDDSGSTDVASADSGAEPGFVAVDDGTGALTMEVPAEWSDVSPGDWAQDELGGDVIGRSIFAAPSIEGLTSGAYDTPGVFFGASSALVEGFPDDTANQLLDQDFLDFSGECDYEGRSEYDDGVYVGQQDFYVNCGDTGAERRHIVALPEDGSFVALLQITVTDEASAEAATRIEETFLVDPSGL